MTTAQQLGDQGAAQVADHNREWMENAMLLIDYLVWRGDEVTADDLRKHCKAAPHQNCVGAAFMALSKQGKIKCVGYTQSTHPSTHGRLIRKWGRV